MANRIHRLKAVHLKKLQGPSKHCDGGGLWLYVSDANAGFWVFRYRLHGRDREMGLGPLTDVSLSDARDLAKHYRGLKRDGVDPYEAREAERHRRALEAASNLTFKECAERLLRSKEDAWRNEKHRKQWRSTLETYAYPVLGDLPIQGINVGHVMRVLEPIWKKKPETASRLRQRVEAVLAWATAQELRDGDNPARWKGHLENLLPAISKTKRVRHHAALPWQEMPAFMQALRRREGTAARALELLILTAARSGEIRGATWEEIDLEARTWTVPAERMKARSEHVVPLSDPAVSLLEALPRLKDCPYVFFSSRGGPLSDMALSQLTRRMEVAAVPHGFRSTFRDWAAESTAYPHEVAEMALAHTIKSAVERAYRRGDLMTKRRRMMADWAAYLDSEANRDVTPIRSKEPVYGSG